MMKILHSYAEALLKAKIIPNWRLHDYHHAEQMKDLFDFLKIKTVLDIGANEGQYAEFLRYEVEFKGTIVSFEPSAAQFEILEVAAQNDLNWHPVNIALGERTEIKSFNVMAGSQYSSVFMPRDYQYLDHRNVVVDNYNVEVRTLNEIWGELAEHYDLSSVFMKMDTQGSDLNILKGGDWVLGSIWGIQSELSIIPLYEDMPGFIEVIKYLYKRGFALSHLHPVLKDKNRQLVECDGVFIRSIEK